MYDPSTYSYIPSIYIPLLSNIYPLLTVHHTYLFIRQTLTITTLTPTLFLYWLHDISSLQNDGSSPLQAAAAGGHDAVVTVLLDNGANINHANKVGWSSLHLSAYNGHETMVGSLIDRGADVNLVNNDGDRPIDVAKTQKIKDMLIALTKEKPQEEGQQQPPGQAVPTIMDESQWFRAAKKGDLALIQQGINDNKIDVNCRDSGSRTAVYWAAQEGRLPLMEYLITQHADLSISTVIANNVL